MAAPVPPRRSRSLGQLVRGAVLRILALQCDSEGLKQPISLEAGGLSRRRRGRACHVFQPVVALGAVASTGTAAHMVPISVSYTIAQRAVVIRFCNRQPKA